jgi:hypothetical protein
LEDIKVAYRERYGVEMVDDVREGTRFNGDLGVFLQGLCVRRVEDEVRVMG